MSSPPNTAKLGRRENDGPEDFSNRLVTVLNPAGGASEAYRTLRTNLIYGFVDNPPKVIVITSPRPGEGKSTTCANLGVVLVQAAKDTLILDCDFRKPVIHKFFNIPNRHGLTDVLAGKHSLQEVWREPTEGLKVVPVGPIPLNPAEILGSKRFTSFLADVREQFDYVLIDASPVGLVSDPAIVAIQGDGVLLVIDAQNSRKGSVRRAMSSLETVGAKVLGTVMNNVKVSEDSYYYYSYPYQ